MAQAAGGRPIPQTVEAAIQQIESAHLPPEQVALLMRVNDQARAVFGNEMVWQTLAEHLHLQIPADRHVLNQWRLSVEALYAELNNRAYDVLRDAAPQAVIAALPADVFARFTYLKERLELLGKDVLKNFIENEMNRAFAANQPGALRVLFNAGGKISETAITIGLARLSQNAREGNGGVVVQCLIDAGIPVNARDNEGETAFMRFASRGDLQTLEFLIARRADINATDNAGRTPLIRAASTGKNDVVQWLLAREGINVNATDNEGRTALMRAVLANDVDIIRSLVGARGINLNLRDNDGRSALSIARDLDRGDQIISLLQPHGAA